MAYPNTNMQSNPGTCFTYGVGSQSEMISFSAKKVERFAKMSYSLKDPSPTKEHDFYIRPEEVLLEMMEFKYDNSHARHHQSIIATRYLQRLMIDLLRTAF